MGWPTRFALHGVSELVEHNVLYNADNFGDSGSPTPGIAASVRGGGLFAMKLGPSATSGSPDMQRKIDFGSEYDQIWIDMEIYFDYDDGAGGSNGNDFLNFFRILRGSGGTVMELGQLDGGETGIKTIGTSWGANNFTSDHIAAQTPTRIKVHVIGSSSVGAADGTINVYVHDGTQFNLRATMTHDDGKPQQVVFMNRPLNDILAEGPTVEFRKLAISLDDGDINWSDLEACAQLRGCANSNTAGLWDQAIMVNYDPRLWGTPSGAIQAEVQASTDPGFASGVIYGSVELVSADAYTSLTLTDNPDFSAVAVLQGLDPNETYHYRVRFVDGGTINAADEAITGGSQVLLTDNKSFGTLSAPGGAAATLKLMSGGCQRHHNTLTPHAHWAQTLTFDADLVLALDDFYYETTHNGLASSNTQAAGATRTNSYMTRARASAFLPYPWVSVATTRPCLLGMGNHPVDANHPGNASPTNLSLATDALFAWRRYCEDGMLLEDRPEGDWGYIDTAKSRLFMVNAVGYDHEDASTHGPEGRQLIGGSAYPVPRLLGATQMAALLEAIEQCDLPLFILAGMPPFASDADPLGTEFVGWPLAPDQRQAVIDAINANANIRAMLPISAHAHFACLTKQGYQSEDKILPNVIGNPLAQTIGSNYDEAFLAGFDGGFIFKSDDGAGEGNPASMQAQITIDEAALDGSGNSAVTIAFVDGEGNELHSSSYDVPPTTLQPLGGTLTHNPHPPGTGNPRNQGFTVPGDPQPEPRGSGKPREWRPRT